MGNVKGEIEELISQIIVLKEIIKTINRNPSYLVLGILNYLDEIEGYLSNVN